jgi:hypothetical protein
MFSCAGSLLLSREFSCKKTSFGSLGIFLPRKKQVSEVFFASGICCLDVRQESAMLHAGWLCGESGLAARRAPLPRTSPPAPRPAPARSPAAPPPLELLGKRKRREEAGGDA